MELCDLIVLTAHGSTDPAVAVAACRAGARGTLDCEHLRESASISSALDRLAKSVPSHRFGVQVDIESVHPVAEWCEQHRILPGWLIVSGGLSLSDRRLQTLKAAGVELLAEACTLTEAMKAVELGADGIILKGNESGGRVGLDSAFLLVQKWHRSTANRSDAVPPFWVRGGIGPNTAAACRVAGARGVVLDSQLLLSRESSATDDLRKRILGFDGSETTVLGERLGEPVRLYARADSPAAGELAALEEQWLLAAATDPPQVHGNRRSEWRKAVHQRVAAEPGSGAWLVGQDLALTATLAMKTVTVAGLLQTILARANQQAERAAILQPLAPESPLARSHGTRYPILQGPMTRVSDTAAFAEAVARAGGLPFLALALFRKAEVERLLAETQQRLQGKPWGVGILGFVSPELRSEQLEVVRRYRPPFAIIAGGRPDQARELEQQGIATYLHVPSPGLLKMFLHEGARRFIFEGRECGGHVGPRSSFVLWEAMIEVLRDYAATSHAEAVHAVFAGGIHDDLSAAMVAALSVGLAERGMKIGVLLGTAYLFTPEAVDCGAITAHFQKQALSCRDTVLLETGPGHAIRVIPTPYADDFEAEKRRLKSAGKTPLEIGIALERMNLGRLRVASKGVDRAAVGPSAASLVPVSEEEQYRRGMYMIGQVAALREQVISLAELHQNVSVGSGERLRSLSPYLQAAESAAAAPPPCDIAVIGLACFYPNAGGLWPFWENILHKRQAVTEIPPSHWDWRLYYDPDPRAKDKSISKWGGFLADVPFDPLRFGITPKSIPNIEPLQLMLLEAVRQALADAGYAERDFPRERTAAILGIGGGGMPLSVAYGFRSCMPLMDTIPGIDLKGSEVVAKGTGILPEWTEDSFPGILLNVAAGRVANRFDLGGPNMAIDAACGSSLAAVYAGIRELTVGTSDMAIVMGADTVQTPYAYVAFSKTHALSPRGRCRPFDAEADGIALSEGIGVAILKRLSDAERDGDRIYAVIRGIGASSDGRAKGLTAPRAEGQMLALTRAYAQARISPARVGLVEAHGTGTVVGDQTEALALGQLYREAGGKPQSCALGSVKSMIGHSKCAAGLAGLIKVAMALHHKVLPPTLVEKPNPRANFEGGPLYLNRDARPWIHGGEQPRVAGVSAFGFGGTNFHAVLEEYTGDFLNRPESGLRTWPAELFVWRRPDRGGLLAAVQNCHSMLAAGASPSPAELAASLWHSSRGGQGQPTLAIVAENLLDLRAKLELALPILASQEATRSDPRGIYFAEQTSPTGKLAFLFPGQGSQYPDMLGQVAMAFPQFRAIVDRAERVLGDSLEKPLGKFIYPPSAFNSEQAAELVRQLQRTEVAQPALGAVSLGMARLLGELGLTPDLLAGHSYGEYVALAVAGAVTDDDLIRLSFLRGRVLQQASLTAGGGMIAVDATPEKILPILNGLGDIWPANQNSPQQTVLAGTEGALSSAAEKLKQAGFLSQRIPVACGFHSPLIAAARGPLSEALAGIPFRAPILPVYSNTTAAPYDSDPALIRKQLVEHLVSPVMFKSEIEALYTAGARIFVEVGPQAVLTGLTQQILKERPHLAVASDLKNRPGLTQLSHLLGQLLIHGLPVSLDLLFKVRGVPSFDLAKLGPKTGIPHYTPTTWLVNGVRSRPIDGPEPRILGQPLASSEPLSATTAASPHPHDSRNPTAAMPGTPPSSPPSPAMQPPLPADARQKAAVEQPASAKTISTSAAISTPASTSCDSDRETTTMESARPLRSVSANSSRQPPLPPNATVAPNEASAQVMLRFQDVMARFLETQRAVMLSYLTGAERAAATDSINSSSASSRAINLPAPTATAAPASGNPAVDATNTAKSVVVPDSVPTFTASTEKVPDDGIASKGPKDSEKTTVAATVMASATQLDRETLLDRLLDLVSERTGYPKEALSIDLDLEADLGVDSIKRVEILGTLAESIEAGHQGNPPPLEMETLSTIKTLRGIADYVLEALASSNQSSPGVEDSGPVEVPKSAHHRFPESHDNPEFNSISVATNGTVPVAREGEVQRLAVRIIPAPRRDSPSFAMPAGVILLTDDGGGIARAVAERLGELDLSCVLIQDRTEAGDACHPYQADLANPAEVTRLVAAIRASVGPIAGLIHLLPLTRPAKTVAKVAPASSERGIPREVQSLYLLAQALESDLRNAAASGPAVLLAVTGMGGRLGIEGDLPGRFTPNHGGVAGLTKCLAFEWPTVQVRVLDVDPEIAPQELAEQIVAELGESDGPVEVGYCAAGRVTSRCEPAPLPSATSAGNARISFGPQSTFLVTGGARGITAKVAEELARQYRCRLIVIGSSPLPAEESPELAGLHTPAEIKAALMQHYSGKPAAVEAAYQRLRKDREIRANLAAIRAAGATVEYHSVDLLDSQAFAQFLSELQARQPLDGVIHGAGIIEDKLLKDKTPESFERVFRTKVDSARVLAETLNPRQVKVVLLFSSIASRFGNKGQSDYAAANEVLSKLAQQLDRRWPGRVVSIAWGPWASVGMVADLEKHLVARGLKLITPDVGARFAVDELSWGGPGPAEVVVAGGREPAPTREAAPRSSVGESVGIR